MILRHLKHAWKPALAAGVLALAGCGGGGGGSDAGAPAPVPTRTVSGSTVKGPLQGATIQLFDMDALGNPTGQQPLCAGSTGTDGAFTVTGCPTRALLAMSSGGSYVDESDPAPVGSRRHVVLAAGDHFYSVLPAGSTTLALTPLTSALWLKAKTQANGNNFPSIYAAVLAQAQGSLGFDPTTLIPADPSAPASSASAQQKNYALLLGGAANAINRIAVDTGHAAPDFTLIDAFIRDLSDGRVDGREGSTALTVGNAAIPDVDFNAEVRRFRNNNNAAYSGVTPPQLDETTLSLPVTPANRVPTLAALSNVTVNEDNSATVGLALADADEAADGLTYRVTSSNAALVPGIASQAAPVSGNFNITLTPVADQSGSSTITVIVDDGDGGTATRSFTLTVTPVNDAPTLSAISSPAAILEDAVQQTVSFSGVSAGGGESQALTVTAVSSNPGLIPNPVPSYTSPNATGSLSYTPVANQSGTATITVTVTDAGSATATRTFTVTVNPVNDAPVASGQAITVAEAGTKTGVLVASDIDNASLTYSVVAAPLHGTLTITNAATGAFSYVHDGSDTTTDSFTFKASDGAANSNTATVSITVTPVNDAPVASGQAITVAEAGTKTGTLVATDSDSASLTYSVVANGAHGTVTITNAATGAFSYVHDGSDTTTDSFTFKANDGSLNSNTATVSITVTPVNDAPVASAQAITVAEGATKTGTLAATDSDSASLTYSVVANGAHGTVTITNAATGAFSYVHDGSDTTTDSFTFKANDGSLNSNTATVSITVTPVNDAPVASAQAIIVAEGATKTGTLAATDSDSASLIYSVVANGAHGTVTITNAATGAFSYVHDGSDTTTDSFTFKASDGSLNSNTATVSITVTPVNDAPVASGQAITVAEAGTKTGTLVATDSDSASLTYSVVANGAHGTVTITNAATGAFSYVHDGSETTSDTFTFKASDGSLNSNTATVNITVTPVNDAPVAGAQSLGVAEGGTLTGNVAATDVDNASLTYSIVGAATNGTVTITNAATGAFSYTHNGSETTTDSFTFKANDGTANSNTATISITVTPVNDAPVASGQAISVAEGGTKTGTLVATDADNASLTYSVVTPPANGTLTITNAATGAYSYVHNGGETTGDSFTFRATDGTANSNTATVTITVTPVNDAPVAGAQSLGVVEGGTLTGNVSATDADNASLTYSIVGAAANGTVTITNAATGAFTYTHNGGETTSDSFTFRANDGTTNSNTATISITVTPVNDAPVAGGQSLSVAEGGTLTGNVAATDVDNASLTYSIVGAAANGTVTITNAATGAFTYTHNGNETTTDSFTFKANDGSANSNTATISITVTPVNDAPVASGQSLSVNEGGTLTGTVTATDADNASLTYSVVGAAANGTVTITNAATGAFTYTHNGGETTSDSFTFRANDGSANSNTATISITVTPVNDAPVAAAGVLTVFEGGTQAGSVSATDADSGSLTYSITAGAAHGTVTITNPATGAFSYTHDGVGSPTTDSFTFQASDGSLSSTAVVSITVTPVNDVPVADAASFSVAEGATKVGTLTASDEESASLTYAVATPPAHGTLTIVNPATGSYTYDHDGGETTGDSFSFTASDGTATSTAATVTITITPVNDAPVAMPQSFTVAEGATATGTLVGTDVDTPTLTWQIDTFPSHGTVTITDPLTGAFSYAHDGGETSSDSFSFHVRDGSLDSNVAAVTITVSAQNDAPIMSTIAGLTVAEGASGGISFSALRATDVDNTSAQLTYAITTPPGHGSLTLSGSPASSFTQADIDAGLVAYTNNGDEASTDSFAFTVSDNGTPVQSVSAGFGITVTPVNDQPSISSAPPSTATEDTLYTWSATVTDLDGPSATWSISAGNDTCGGSINSSSGVYTFTPAGPVPVNCQVAAQVCDGSPGLCDTRLQLVTVTPVNDAPLAGNDVYGTNHDVTLTVGAPGVLGNDADPEGTALSATATVQPLHGTLSLATDGSFTYAPTLGYVGVDSFTYSTSDGALSATATVTLTISDSAPVASNISPAAFNEDTQSLITLPYTDAEGDLATTCQVGVLSNVTITQACGCTAGVCKVGVTGTANYSGSGSFNYRVTAAGQQSNVAVATLSITGVNDPPDGADRTLTINEDTVFAFAPGDFGFSDTDGNSLLSITVTPPTNGTLSYNGVPILAAQEILVATWGNLWFTPASNAYGTGYASFSYQVKDDGGTANGGSNIDAFANSYTIDVTSANDTPQITAQTTVSIVEDGNYTIALGDLTVSDPDVEDAGYPTGFTLQVAAGSGSGSGSYTLSGNQVIPNPDFNGLLQVPVTVKDHANVASGSFTFEITVRPVNDAPTVDDISDVTATVGDSAAVVTLTGLSAGVPANEAIPIFQQLTTVDADSDDPSVVTVSVGYSLGSSSGSLVYTPVGAGTATVTVTVQDNGGTIDGGVDTVTKTFQITVMPSGTRLLPLRDNNGDLLRYDAAGDALSPADTGAPDVGDGYQYLTVHTADVSSGSAIHYRAARTLYIKDEQIKSITLDDPDTASYVTSEDTVCRFAPQGLYEVLSNPDNARILFYAEGVDGMCDTSDDQLMLAHAGDDAGTAATPLAYGIVTALYDGNGLITGFLTRELVSGQYELHRRDATLSPVSMLTALDVRQGNVEALRAGSGQVFLALIPAGGPDNNSDGTLDTQLYRYDVGADSLTSLYAYAANPDPDNCFLCSARYDASDLYFIGDDTLMRVPRASGSTPSPIDVGVSSLELTTVKVVYVKSDASVYVYDKGADTTFEMLEAPPPGDPHETREVHYADASGIVFVNAKFINSDGNLSGIGSYVFDEDDAPQSPLMLGDSLFVGSVRGTTFSLDTETQPAPRRVIRTTYYSDGEDVEETTFDSMNPADGTPDVTLGVIPDIGEYQTIRAEGNGDYAAISVEQNGGGVSLDIGGGLDGGQSLRGGISLGNSHYDLYAANATVGGTLAPVKTDPDSGRWLLQDDSGSIDLDFDGLDSDTEYRLGTNPLLQDTDGDGLSDSQEYYYGSSPFLADTDGDGLNDYDESNNGTNPNLADTDGDGLNDYTEVMVTDTDPSAPEQVLYVSANSGSDSNAGDSWAEPLQTNSAVVGAIAAMRAASIIDPVVVLYEPGTYDPLVMSSDSNGVTFLGGMSSSATAPVAATLPGGTIFTRSCSPSCVAERPVDLYNVYGTLRNIVITGGDVRGLGGADQYGGGIRVDGGASGINVRDSLITANYAGHGGGIAVMGTSFVAVSGTRITGNSAEETSGAEGGGIVVDHSTLYMDTSVVAGNSVTSNGIHYGGGIAVGPFGYADIGSSTIAANTATGTGVSSGGGIGVIGNISDYASLVLHDSRILSNSADDRGGGVYVESYGGSVNLNNNLIVGNAQSDPASPYRKGGGVMFGSDGVTGYTSYIDSNTVAYNQAYGYGGGVYLSHNNTLYLRYGIIYGNEGTSIGGAAEPGDNLQVPGPTVPTYEYNDIGETFAGSTIGGTSADPVFTAGFYLDQASSPVVNYDPLTYGITAAGRALADPNPDTTAMDALPDIDAIDLGYHYAHGAASPGNLINATGSANGCGAANAVFTFTPVFTGAASGESGHLMTVKIASGVASNLRSVTAIQPAAGRVIARDNGDGTYAFTVDLTAIGATSFQIYADDQATPAVLGLTCP